MHTGTSGSVVPVTTVGEQVGVWLESNIGIRQTFNVSKAVAQSEMASNVRENSLCYH